MDLVETPASSIEDVGMSNPASLFKRSGLPLVKSSSTVLFGTEPSRRYDDIQRIIFIQSCARRQILNRNVDLHNLSAKAIQLTWQKYRSERSNLCLQSKYHVLLEKAVVLAQKKW